MQEPSEHVVQVVDSLLYRRDSVSNQDCSVSSLDDDEYSTLALTAEKSKQQKKKKSSLAAKFNDRATNGSLLDNKSLHSSSGDSSSRADDDTSAGGDQWEAADSDVAKLRRELKDAKMDLEIEKSSKKKREKSLLRLAKELNKRVASEKSKDKKIEELEETIADLQQRLEVKTKMVLKEIPELRARLAEKTKALDDHIIAARQQLESSHVLSDAKKSAFYFVFPLLVLLSACGVGIVIPLAKHRGDFEVSKGAIQNFACSAIPPGMILDTAVPQMHSPPFWVPSAYKRSVHAALCTGRPFAIVHVDKSKVVVSTDDGKKPVTHKAPGGISVGLDSRMTLLETKKNKTSRTIPTPWYLEEE